MMWVKRLRSAFTHDNNTTTTMRARSYGQGDTTTFPGPGASVPLSMVAGTHALTCSVVLLYRLTLTTRFLCISRPSYSKTLSRRKCLWLIFTTCRRFLGANPRPSPGLHSLTPLGDFRPHTPNLPTPGIRLCKT